MACVTMPRKLDEFVQLWFVIVMILALSMSNQKKNPKALNGGALQGQDESDPFMGTQAYEVTLLCFIPTHRRAHEQ